MRSTNILTLDQRRTTRPVDNEEPLFGGTPFRDAHTGDGTTDDAETRPYYSLLNIDQDATEDQVREAYKSMAGV